ncbi:MAG: hypothetical protein LQ338_003793 [Usnochroma carphineum]|nr:MAG: hypothetical protein LQ338_003793 [Usnochroma carphineum]
MPSRRIVQDSDDEDNADQSPVKQIETQSGSSSPSKSGNAQQSTSSPQTRSIPSAGPSTGSTGQHPSVDLLDREIQDAHTKLFEPSTSRSSRSSHPSSGPPAASRERAATDPGQEKAKKRKVTYGARKSQENPLLERFSDEDPVQTKKRIRSSINSKQSSRDESDGEGDYHVPGSGSFDAAEKLHGTTQSNTDAPAEKRRQRRDHATPASDASMPPRAFTSSGLTKQSVQFSSGSAIPPIERASPPVADNQTPSERAQTTHFDIAHPSRPTSADHRAHKRAVSELESPKIILGEEVPPSSSAPAESPTKRQRTVARARHVSSPMRSKALDGGHDELSLSAATYPEEKTKWAKPPRAALIGTQQVDELASEDPIPDLPQENYQPRPSRSRSGLTSDDLIVPDDFSKRPETLAKSKTRANGKTKRRKITTSENSSQRQADPSPSIDSDLTERRSKLNVEHDRIPEREHAPLNPDVFDHAERPESNADEPAMDPSPQPPPRKKARGRPKKEAPPQQSLVDSPLIEPPPAAKENPQESPTLIKPAGPTAAPVKRGRKRRKATDADVDCNSTARHQMSSSNGVEDGLGRVLIESNANIQPISLPKEEVAEKQAAEANPSDALKQSNKSSAQLPDEKPLVDIKVKEQKVPTKQSPAQQEGKSVYRVGLSKRQRIPSLLRVVRK